MKGQNALVLAFRHHIRRFPAQRRSLEPRQAACLLYMRGITPRSRLQATSGTIHLPVSSGLALGALQSGLSRLVLAGGGHERSGHAAELMPRRIAAAAAAAAALLLLGPIAQGLHRVHPPLVDDP